MSAFVILAAGRGTRIGRVGESLHKALVPLGERAVISHLFDRASVDDEIIICLGHRGDQIREFVRLAHPRLRPTFIEVDGWDRSGGGPGLSLLAAREVVGQRDMLFTSCDTLWSPIERPTEGSWVAVAPVPAGTQPSRWCRIVEQGDWVLDILDKVPDAPIGLAYTGLARIAQKDLNAFWQGVEHGSRVVAGELQVTGGLRALRAGLGIRHVDWTDVGDAASYSHAVTMRYGYDWTKAGEATYVLPEEGRVVKFWDDVAHGNRSAERAAYIGDAVPTLVDRGRQMLAYEYIEGRTVYETLGMPTAEAHLLTRIYHWANSWLWTTVIPDDDVVIAAYNFYRNKTLERVERLRPELFTLASDVVSRVNWDELVQGTIPVRFHGDFNAGNIIVGYDDRLTGIDWRDDFEGHRWGDRRYDEAKLLAGCVVHWDNARRGDLRPWVEGDAYFNEVLTCIPEGRRRDVQIIAALSLLNSAPLHEPPLDDVLVVRGAAWLERIL